MIGLVLLIVTFFNRPPEVYAEVSPGPAACEARGEELSAQALRLPGAKAAVFHCLVTTDGQKVSS